MKKYRFASAFLILLVLAALLPPVSALAGGNSTTGSGSAILDTMHVNAAAAVLLDADTGEYLYQQEPHVRRFPASVTKVMTCMLVIEAADRGEISLDKLVTVGDTLHAGIGEGGSTQDLKPGEQLTVRDLLHCALIPSANEACNVLAEALSGTVPAFVALMNQRAGELGMEGTHFTNTHGYHDENHYTSAYDVSLMCREAMKHPTFREIVGSKKAVVPATNLHEQRTLHSTNALISTFKVSGYYYSKATGIKTGSTPEAGYCLASSATLNGKNLIAVVMGGTNFKDDKEANYFMESTRLLKFGFENFSSQTILGEGEVDIAEIPVSLSKDANYVTVHPAETLAATLPKDMDINAFQRKITCPETVEAPVKTGQKLGTVTITYRGKTYGVVDLLANSDVGRSEVLYRLDRIQKFFGQLWVKIALIAAGVLAVALVVRRAVFGKRRSRYGAGRGKAYSGGRYTGGRRRR